MEKMSGTGCQMMMRYPQNTVSSPQLSGQRGRSKSLKPQEFVLTLCCLRRGFAETHLPHLFNVSQATVSRIVIS